MPLFIRFRIEKRCLILAAISSTKNNLNAAVRHLSIVQKGKVHDVVQPGTLLFQLVLTHNTLLSNFQTASCWKRGIRKGHAISGHYSNV
jgi:hypothetical protein